MRRLALLPLPSSVLAATLLATLTGACSKEPPVVTANMNLGASLVPVANCDEAASVIRAIALADIERAGIIELSNSGEGPRGTPQCIEWHWV